jgi:peptide/nickel transport system permease protein
VTRGLSAFLVRRLLAAIVFVLLVSSSALVLTRVVPGDATSDLAFTRGGEAARAQARARLGLDRPIASQLGAWLAGLARFDLGRSSRFGEPVADLLRDRAGPTAELAAVALGIAMLLGVPIGVLTGARPRGLFARAITPISLALVACPPLVGALGLLWLALATGGLSVEPGRLAVPALALALPLGAMIERLQSQATTDALAAPDLLAAAARGIPRARLLWIHAARRSLRPVLGLFGIVIGTLFSGSLAVEWVTSWPGLGRLTYDAVVGRDVYLVAGCALAGAILIALGNIVADLGRAVVDPRVREQA